MPHDYRERALQYGVDDEHRILAVLAALTPPLI